jgi:hypothetical protein
MRFRIADCGLSAVRRLVRWEKGADLNALGLLFHWRYQNRAAGALAESLMHSGSFKPWRRSGELVFVGNLEFFQNHKKLAANTSSPLRRRL